MNFKSPFFAVVMPVFNRESQLFHSVNSVLSQSFTDFELICVDDGSTDRSTEIIHEFCIKDKRVKYFHQENLGRCIARNTGIQKAVSDWICFLDSDDLYFENHLGKMIELIQKFPEYHAFATEQSVNGKPKKYKNKRFNSDKVRITLDDTLYSNPISLNQFCYNRSEIKLLFENQNIPVSEDWLFFRKLTLSYPILKTNTLTTDVNEHSGRTMNTTDVREIARWNELTGSLFAAAAPASVAKKVLPFTYLLCANILLSAGYKKESYRYLIRSLNSFNTFVSSLFYKALLKYLLA